MPCKNYVENIFHVYMDESFLMDENIRWKLNIN
jgi:hypothetical protein